MCVYSLEGNKLGAAGAGALAEALKLNEVITDLNLSENDLGVEGAKAIAGALSSGMAMLTTIECVFCARSHKSCHNSCAHMCSTHMPEATNTMGSAPCAHLPEL